MGRVYYLKEKRLSQLLISVLGLENSSRSKTLLNWNDTSDLSKVIFDLISDSVKFQEVVNSYFILRRNTF